MSLTISPKSRFSRDVSFGVYFHSNSILSVESDLLYELHVSLVNVKQVLDFIMVFPK